MAQGYVQILNLRESDSVSKDRSALNNLGGAGIANDLQLFSNNVLNTSIVDASTFTVDVDNYVVLNTNLYQIAFSNRTPVSHNGQSLTVVDSNGIDRFRMADSSGAIITPNASFAIGRSDTVRLSNIRNLIDSGIPTDQTASVLSDEGSISVSESSITIAGQSNTRITLEERFNQINSIVDKYRFDRTFAIITDLPQEFDTRIRYRSTVKVTNDNAISLPTSPGITDDAPGIFIVSGTDSQRAFSNNNNPWSGTVIGSGYMVTGSSKATISTLIVTDPDFELLSTNTILPSNVVNDYTHKIETVINGETYYLLCSDN